MSTVCPAKPDLRKMLLACRAIDGVIVTIREVERGLACRCVCPSCGRGMKANQGEVRQWYFSHAAGGEAGANCGPETGLHLFAKRTLMERCVIVPPASRPSSTPSALTLVAVETEVRRPGWAFIPDAVVVCDRSPRELAVEFVHTSRVGDAKTAQIRDAGLTCMSVDISAGLSIDDRGSLSDFILLRAPRGWVFNPKLEAARQREAEEARLAGARRDEASRAQRVADAAARRAVFDAMRSVRRRVDVARHGPTLAVEAAGLSGLVGVRIPGDDYFPVDCAVWQAAILERHVLRHRGADRPAPHIFLMEIVRWMERESLAPRPVFLGRRGLAPVDHEGWRPTYKVVSDFVDGLVAADLADAGIMEYRSQRHSDRRQPDRCLSFGGPGERRPVRNSVRPAVSREVPVVGWTGNVL